MNLLRETREVLADWKRDHISNSPISRNTEAYNALMPKIEVLKQMLLQDDKPKAPASSPPSRKGDD